MYFDPVLNDLWSQKETLDFQWTGTADLSTDVSNTTVFLTACRELEALILQVIQILSFLSFSNCFSCRVENEKKNNEPCMLFTIRVFIWCIS